MSQTIKLSATEARRNFFEIFDKILHEGVSVILSKKNSPHQVVMKVATEEELAPTTDVNLQELYGIFKVGRYTQDETTKAHEIYARDQAKKYR